jgi:two-component system phosphate regulon sensor histidine kinase PhoR
MRGILPRAFTWNLFGRLFGPLWVGQLAVLTATLILSRARYEFALGAIAVFTAYTLWMSARVVVPLGRLIRKARAASGRSVEAPDDAEIDAELGARQPAELGDIESALDGMRAKLERRKLQLVREREELATVMAAIPDAILAVDRDGETLFFNARFAAQFGGGDFAARRPRLAEVFRAPELLEAYALALRAGETARVDVALRAIDEAAPRDFRLAVSPLRRQDGEPYGAVGVFHEVSELKRAERIRIDFVANVSHELRTPLTAIKGYADTLREDVARGDVAGAAPFVDALGRNVERLMALIEDLLDLSSLESRGGEEALAREDVATRGLTERALAQIERARAAKGIVVVTEYESESVLGDARRLEQVLVNLLDNAVKYIPAGGSISVRWAREGAENVLCVHDDGPGIPVEHLPRLFERFYRVEQARSRDAGGTGLGLAIVKHIVQRHGGTVAVTSEPGRGTEFTCRFPAG